MVIRVDGNTVAIASGLYYLGYAVLASIPVRAILAVFKALAMMDGEHRRGIAKAETSPDPVRGRSICYLWWVGFTGAVGDATTRDYGLSWLIGIAELVAFPVLFETNQLSVIGGWLALKTAGQWGVWEKSRTAFNRFLFGNLLALGVSYFWLRQFISTVP